MDAALALSSSPSNNQTDAQRLSRTSRVEFSGREGEYFKLWLVNLALSLLTLGIYSAWASVRNNQYLYGHTKIEGQGLRYLANPLQVLKGRLIAFACFALYGVLSNLNPMAALILMVAFIVATPWMIVQGIKFKMKMSAYRNVRFSFEGSYWGALVHFILLPILAVFTLYLAMPWVSKKIDQFVHANIRYAGKPFSVSTEAGQYYLAVLASVVVSAIAMSLAMALGSIFVDADLAARLPEMFASADTMASSALILAMFSLMVVYLLLFQLVISIYQGMVRNHLLSSMSIDGVVSLRSEIKLLPFARLNISNMLLLIATLGLAYPVAKVRLNRHLCEATQITLTPDADSLINTISDEHSAFGEELAGFFDTDLALV